jgi:TIR domain
MSPELEERSRGPRVFVSYSFANPSIGNVKRELENLGFRPTIVDDTTLLGKESLTESIAALIREADYVVPVVDAHAVGSAWVHKEVELATEAGVPFIPLLEPRVEPTGVFEDVPSVLNMDIERLAKRLLKNYVLLEFDESYPAHVRLEALVRYMSGEQPGLVDPTRRLSSKLRPVFDALLGVDHEPLHGQMLRYWSHLQDAFDELQAIAPIYRTAIRPFLEGWGHGRDEIIGKTWNAVARLIVGRQLMLLIQTASPEFREEWGPLRPGATRMHDEWSAISESDPMAKCSLWGVGARTFPLQEWANDPQSPLGEWLLVDAEYSTGLRRKMIVPNRKVIASGVRLHEPPRRYLQSWEWLEFVLPQLATGGAPSELQTASEAIVALREV